MYSFSPLLMPVIVAVMILIALAGMWKSRGGRQGYTPRPCGFGGGFAIAVTLFFTYRMIVSLLFIYSLHETLEGAGQGADIVDCYLVADLPVQALAVLAFLGVVFVKPWAIKVFRTYLVVYTAYIFALVAYMPLVVESVTGFSAHTLAEFVNASNLQAMEGRTLTLVFTALWLMFLHKSRRVRHTWPSFACGTIRVLM